MAISEIIELAKEYYPEPINSELISQETGISRGTILRAIARIRAHPNLYDELLIYEEFYGNGKPRIQVMYDKHYMELKK